MALGPGRYDDVCTAARTMSGAEVAIVLILNGDRGSGFSIQGDEHALLGHLDVARLLEHVAATLRKDLG